MWKLISFTWILYHSVHYLTGRWCQLNQPTTVWISSLLVFDCWHNIAILPLFWRFPKISELIKKEHLWNRDVLSQLFLRCKLAKTDDTIMFIPSRSPLFSFGTDELGRWQSMSGYIFPNGDEKYLLLVSFLLHYCQFCLAPLALSLPLPKGVFCS